MKKIKREKAASKSEKLTADVFTEKQETGTVYKESEFAYSLTQFEYK